MFVSNASENNLKKRYQSLLRLTDDHDAFSTSLKSLRGRLMACAVHSATEGVKLGKEVEGFAG
jgi:hypothetical protein